MGLILCRAKVSSSCYHGRPAKGVYESGDQSEDGTWDWRSNTVVCDACYTVLIPLTPSQQGLTHELSDAIATLRDARGDGG